jgi:hypothetical protein
MREPERFEGLTNWRLDCSNQVEELLGRDDQLKRANAARFMATVVSEDHEVTGSPDGCGQQQLSGNSSPKENAYEKEVSGDNTAGKEGRAHEIAPWQRSV